MAERSRDRSSSTESQPKFPECSHFQRRNDNHRRCQQCRLNDGLPLCTQDSPCLVCQGCQKLGQRRPRLQHREIAARPLPRRKQRGRKLRWWTTQWNYTHQGTLFLPSVSSPRSHLRPSGLRQSQVHRKPSPWLPASRRWNGPAPSGRTTAGRGRLSANEDTANLRGISRHVVTATTATGERASGARPSSSGGSSSRRHAESGSVSKASDTRPSSSSSRHHQHHSTGDRRSLSSSSSRAWWRGWVGRLLPDGSSSYPLRNPRPLRNAPSRWLPRRLDRFILNRPQQSRPR